VTELLVHDGGPVILATQGSRVGEGPWSRLLAEAAVPNEGSTTAAEGRTLARGGRVHALRVRGGTLRAKVADQDVVLEADPVARAVWAGVRESAHGAEALEAVFARDEQSSELQHLMITDWGEPLVPRTHALRQSCTCHDSRTREPGNPCRHIAALTYVMVDAIDRDPSLLLRWRGCEDDAVDETAVVAPSGDGPWRAGPLPAQRPPRDVPAGVVLKRLGPSGLRLGDDDLVDVLYRAYEAFARAERP
jgi:hypothetical protein